MNRERIVFRALASQRGFSLMAVFVLVVILIGLATYMMADKGLNTTKNAATRMSMNADGVIAQAGYLRGGFNMMVAKGVSPREITFDKSPVTGLFNAATGTVAPQTPDPIMFSWPTVAHSFGFWIYRKIKINGVGSGGESYGLLLNGVWYRACQELQRKLHGTTTPFTSAHLSTEFWLGDMDQANNMPSVADPTVDKVLDLSGDAQFNGKLSGCIKTGDPAPKYSFYQILLPQ